MCKLCCSRWCLSCFILFVMPSMLCCSVFSFVMVCVCCIGGIGLSPLFCYRGESKLGIGMKGRGLVSMSPESKRSRGRNAGECSLPLCEKMCGGLLWWCEVFLCIPILRGGI